MPREHSVEEDDIEDELDHWLQVLYCCHFRWVLVLSRLRSEDLYTGTCDTETANHKPVEDLKVACERETLARDKDYKGAVE